MEIIKKKILLEDYIDRSEAFWGTPKWVLDPTFDSFRVNVFFSQDSDDMGMLTDLDFVPDPGASFLYNPLTPDIRFPGKELQDYFIPGGDVSAYTDDRIDSVRSYDVQNEYKIGFDMESELVDDYQGNQHTSVTRVLDNNNMLPITYIDGGDDSEISSIDLNNPKPQLGILFKTYFGKDRLVTDPSIGSYFIPLTEVYYKAQGFNMTNTSLSAFTREEYLFGITRPPDVFSDVFIDRGRNTIMQNHFQMAEIMNMADLMNYGNGYYKIQK
jgi:hypothetical protein